VDGETTTWGPDDDRRILMACAALGPIHATFSILAAQNGRTPVQVQRRFDWLWARMAAAAA
jgi:hypothetical protein